MRNFKLKTTQMAIILKPLCLKFIVRIKENFHFNEALGQIFIKSVFNTLFCSNNK